MTFTSNSKYLCVYIYMHMYMCREKIILIKYFYPCNLVLFIIFIMIFISNHVSFINKD